MWFLGSLSYCYTYASIDQSFLGIQVYLDHLNRSFKFNPFPFSLWFIIDFRLQLQVYWLKFKILWTISIWINSWAKIELCAYISLDLREREGRLGGGISIDLIKYSTYGKKSWRGSNNANWENMYDMEEPQFDVVLPPKFYASFWAKDKNKVDGKQQAVENQDSPKLLYFEFVASEVCLEDACSCLDNEVKNNSVAFLKSIVGYFSLSLFLIFALFLVVIFVVLFEAGKDTGARSSPCFR